MKSPPDKHYRNLGFSGKVVADYAFVRAERAHRSPRPILIVQPVASVALMSAVTSGVFAFGMAPACRGALSSDAIAQRIGSL